MAKFSAVRRALLLNALLVTLAFVLPRVSAARQDGFAGATTAALLFLVPMIVALLVGIVTAVRTYSMARKRKESMPWVGFAPLGVFGFGVLGLMVLVAAR
jgi:hypothetical protein